MSLHYSELAPPLIGCLVCHAEGTITEFAPQRWWRSAYPLLKCSHCGSIARFENNLKGEWRLQYQHINPTPHYHYAAYRFGRSKWVTEDTALDLSRDAYIQRHRLQQVEAGNIGWLTPITLDEIGVALDDAEQPLLQIDGVKLGRRVDGDGNPAAQVDFGTLIVTDRRLHMAGQERPWIYEWNAISKSIYTGNTWTLDFSDTHFIEHGADDDSIDAQLFVAVINHLRQRR